MTAALIESPVRHAACPRCGHDLRGLRSGELCPECGFTLGTPGIENGIVTDHRPCLQCGYNLAGLPVDGRCPECAAEVARSLQGNLLVYSAPRFVRRLAVGAMCVLIGVILFALWIGTQLLPAMDLGKATSSRITFAVLCVVANGVSLSGWWLLSTPDPALIGQDRVTGARKILRVTLIIAIASFVVGLIAQLKLEAGFVGSTPQPSATAKRVMLWSILVFFLNWPVKAFASLQYVRALAMRIPSLVIAARAKHLVHSALGGAAILFCTVALPVSLEAMNIDASGLTFLVFLPLCGAFIAVLIWWAVYAGLIGSLRSELALIAHTQARSSPATKE